MKREPLQPLVDSELSLDRGADLALGRKEKPKPSASLSDMLDNCPFLKNADFHRIVQKDTLFFQPVFDAVLTFCAEEHPDKPNNDLEDPLLLIVPDLSNPLAVNFWHQGNFGLPPEAPGHLAGPLPQEALQGPNALGLFLSTQHGFVNKGGLLAFRVSSFHDLDEASMVLSRSRQFSRVGPHFAAQFGLAAQPRLVRYFIMTTMASDVQELGSFGYIP